MKNPRQNDRCGEHCVRNSHRGNHDSVTLLLHPWRILSTRAYRAVECAVLSAREFTLHNKSKIAARRSQGTVSDVSLRYWLQSLACFFFSAFFQRRLARKFYAAFVVDTDAFDPNHVANFDHVLGAFYSKIRELGNVHQAVFAWKNFNKRPELLRRDDASLIGCSYLDFARHPADNFFRARHALASRCVDVHRAVVFDVNFGAGFRDDALDGFAAGPDE